MPVLVRRGIYTRASIFKTTEQGRCRACHFGRGGCFSLLQALHCLGQPCALFPVSLLHFAPQGDQRILPCEFGLVLQGEQVVGGGSTTRSRQLEYFRDGEPGATQRKPT